MCMNKWKWYIVTVILCITLAGCKSKQPDTEEGTEHKQEQQLTEEEREQKKEEIIEDMFHKKEESENIVRLETVQARFMNSLIYRYSPGSESKISFVEKENDTWMTVFAASDYSQVISYYNVEEDEEELYYAFVVKLGSYEGGQPEDYPVKSDDESEDEFYKRVREFNREQVIEALKKTKLQIVKDYPFCVDYELNETQSVYAENYEGITYANCYDPYCAVVGTIKDMKELCELGQPINGLYLHFMSALRPDLIECLTKKGYEVREYSWYGYSSGKYNDALGDELYPMITVNVE